MTTPRHDPAQTDRQFIAALRVQLGQMAHLIEQEVFTDPATGHRTSLRRVLRVEIQAALQACEARLAKEE